MKGLRAGYERMNKPLINPVKGKKDPVIDLPVVFLTNPWMFKGALETFNLKPLAEPNFHFTYLYCVESRFYFVGYAIGSPWAALILEKLVVCGANQIIITGSCGSVSEDLKIGELFLADKGFIEEGTSKAYGKTGFISYPDIVLTNKVYNYITDEKITRGGIWTTDAPYNETIRKVRKFQELGAVAVDMETSALFTVGRKRKAAVSSLLVVSDELSGNTWKSGFTDRSFKEGVKRLFVKLKNFFVA